MKIKTWINKNSYEYFSFADTVEPLKTCKENFEKCLPSNFARYYSTKSHLLIHLVMQPEFTPGLINKKTSVYAAVGDGDLFEVAASDKKNDVLNSYGPRQYLKSFAPFIAYGPVNYLGLQCPVFSMASGSRAMINCLQEAYFDLKNGSIRQVIILAIEDETLELKSTRALILITSNVNFLHGLIQGYVAGESKSLSQLALEIEAR